MLKKKKMLDKKDIKKAKEALNNIILKAKISLDFERFYELCFALCSPQVPIEKNIELNKKLWEMDFCKRGCDLPTLIKLCEPVRFKRRKAEFLRAAQKNWKEIDYFVDNCLNKKNVPYKHLRSSLVQNTLGLGFKTASHFLRNAYGIKKYAILDTHVLSAMLHGGIVDLYDIRNMTGKNYLAVEKKFIKWAEKLGVSHSVLDLYLFQNGSGISWKEIR